MGYEQDKERRIREFADFWDCCEGDLGIVRSVHNTRSLSIIYEDPVNQLKSEDIGLLREDGNNIGLRTVFCDVESLGRVIAEADAYDKNGGIALLYALSGTNPGDGVIRGSTTGEAWLCRRSTLYFCLQGGKLFRNFYERNRCNRAMQDSNMCVYMPGVLYMPEESVGHFITIDVIGTAMPRISNVSTNEQGYREVMANKLNGMIAIARHHGLKNMIIMSDFSDCANCI